MGERIRLFLADDHTMVREGLAALLNRAEDIDIVGECGDGLRVVREVLAARPDVVVLDLSLPGLNGLDICRQLARKAPDCSVLVVTMHSDEEFMVRALQNGACGYLLKEAAADQLVQAVRIVARGQMYLGPGVPRTVLKRLAAGAGGDPYDLLTTRERQVLQLIAEGRKNRDIAELLGLSVKTVDTHRAHLMRKLDIHNQTDLVKFAIRKGIIRG